MSVVTILLLIFALVSVLIAASGIEQYKKKIEFERHQKLLQLAAVLQEDDELLINKVQLPMSNRLIALLLRRNVSVIEQIIELMPNSNTMHQRLADTKEQLNDIDVNIKGRPDLAIPTSDQHSAALIKTIKKMRYILSKQKGKGNISVKDFMEEDNTLGFYLLKIFVEYKINQGIYAISEKKLGSARQFFEKALKTLANQKEYPEYVEQKTKEVYERLEGIAEKMKENMELEAAENLLAEGEKDVLEDLELVFNPTKKKW